MNYYEILGINENATQSEIKKAYIKLANKYHPDKSKEDTTKIMAEINEAYNVLSDPEKREAYDLKIKPLSNEDYEEAVKDYDDEDIKNAEKYALKQIIEEELLKFDLIIDIKKDILLNAYNDMYSEEEYLEEIKSLLKEMKQYASNLQNLMHKAEKFNLNKETKKISETISRLKEELDGIPSTLNEAKELIEKIIYKEKLKEEAERFIEEFETYRKTVKESYKNCYLKNEDNEDLIKKSAREMLGKAHNLYRLMVQYGVNIEKISSITFYLDTLIRDHRRPETIGKIVYINEEVLKQINLEKITLDKTRKIKTMVTNHPRNVRNIMLNGYSERLTNDFAKKAQRLKSLIGFYNSKMLCFGEYDEDFELAHDNIVRFENVCSNIQYINAKISEELTVQYYDAITSLNEYKFIKRRKNMRLIVSVSNVVAGTVITLAALIDNQIEAWHASVGLSDVFIGYVWFEDADRYKKQIALLYPEKTLKKCRKFKNAYENR